MSDAEAVLQCAACHAILSSGGKHSAKCPMKGTDIRELSAKVDAIAEGMAFLLRHGTRYLPNIGTHTRRAALALADKLEGK